MASPETTQSKRVVLQRKCACGSHANSGEECAGCSKDKAAGLQHSAAGSPPVKGVLQPAFGSDLSRIPVHGKPPAPPDGKLTVNARGDIYEQEADAVAGNVVRMAAGTTPQAGTEQPIRRGITGDFTAQATPPSVDEVLSSPGLPLDADTRAFMEPRFGRDFSQVRVHSGPAAEQSARDVGAAAYTVGHQLVFGAGRLAPQTHEGRQLIAHELTHVVQQSGARSLQRQPAAPQAAAPVDDVGRAVGAAERARRDAKNPTTMMISGSEIVYRLIHSFMPDYADRVSGVGYEEKLPGVRVEVSNSSISITVGSQFVLGISQSTVERRALDLGAAILAKAPRQERPKRGLLGEMRAETQRAPGPPVDFDQALKEGGEVLHAANFGLTCGSQSGPDVNDRYDARDWKEKEGRREILVAKIEPWLAFSNLLRNVRTPVPSPSGSNTTWSFDCFGFVIVNRVYAHWRTLSRSEFNSHFTPFELGINASINKEFEKPIEALKPGDKPFISGEVKPNAAGQFVEERTPVGKTWAQVIDTAPIGSQVTWGNQDAKIKCGTNPGLSFCAYTFENSTKVGPNQYSAHPFGIVSREFIETEMAKAVLEAEHKPTAPADLRAYIKRYIYISGVRIPKQPAASTTST